MTLIYETENFQLVSPELPLVSREDGGHLIIRPKRKVSDRTRLEPREAIELTRLTMAAGEAFAKVMNQRGVDIGRINYQDNGNWSVFKPEGPTMHIHLYGRAKSAKVQKYGEALHHPKPDTGFYKDCEPLTEEDLEAIRDEILRVLEKPKFNKAGWTL